MENSNFFKKLFRTLEIPLNPLRKVTEQISQKYKNYPTNF